MNSCTKGWQFPAANMLDGELKVSSRRIHEVITRRLTGEVFGNAEEE